MYRWYQFDQTTSPTISGRLVLFLNIHPLDFFLPFACFWLCASIPAASITMMPPQPGQSRPTTASGSTLLEGPSTFLVTFFLAMSYLILPLIDLPAWRSKSLHASQTSFPVFNRVLFNDLW